MKERLKIDWAIKSNNANLRNFITYLKNRGARPATIETYIFRVSKYLEFCGKAKPSPELAQKFRESLLDRGLSNSSIMVHSFAMKSYHKMLGQDIKFPNLPLKNTITNYFSASDVNNIFDSIKNIKHLALFKTAFYACLRASELCNLDVEDINFDNSSLLVREGKGGKSATCFLQAEVIEILQEYLAVKPFFEIDDRNPLFFTDFGNRYTRRELYHLVVHYKEKANIKKPGGCHVLFRHSPASLMVLNGCDLLTIKEVMRHSDITTTMRYLHLSDGARRAKYNEFLRL